MIVTADWVLPVSAPPIERGAVAVHADTIVDVGSEADVRSRWPKEPVEDLQGCIVAPGLVNAHTHLALSAIAGLVPPGPFHPWLRQVTKVVLGLSHEEFGDSAAGGALECLRSGTTSVGDIVYGSESLHSAASVGLGGVFFWEVLGMTSAEMSESLERRGYPSATEGQAAEQRVPGQRVPGRPRARAGLSPHAPYSSGPELIQATAALARKRGEAFAIHVSEAAGEVELIEAGTGPFTVQAERLAHGFDVPGGTPVAYLDSLGVLDGATCVHAVQVTADDIGLLARHARAVVVCPRSNAYLDNGTPPVAALKRAGAALAIGTDSAASNHDLDLFAEARAVREIDSDMTAEELLEAMTLGGATALGLEGTIGELAPGVSADLVAVEASVAPGQSPVEVFVDAGGPETVSAVMSAGVWRVREGRFESDTSEIEAAASAARDHAMKLLAEGA